MSNTNSSNLIIMNYPPYTGGRFIANCLSLSRHTLPTDPSYADYLISAPVDYNYRLDVLLKTLPSADHMTQWLNYEMDILTPIDFLDHAHSAKRESIKKMAQSGMSFFVIAHGGVEGIKSVIDIWKNAKIIKLVNSRKFQNTCLELKKSARTLIINNDITKINGNECEERYNVLKGSDWPNWQEFDLSGCDTQQFNLEENIKQNMNKFYKWGTVPNQRFTVDVDSNILNPDQIIEQIRKLYDKLSFDDFSPDLVRQYCVPYIKLHN